MMIFGNSAKVKLFRSNSLRFEHGIICCIFFLTGIPRPRVTWYLENVVIDDSYEERKDGLTVNTLTFPNVGRQHLNARLVCQASNTNLAPPETKVLILDINRKYLFS